MHNVRREKIMICKNYSEKVLKIVEYALIISVYIKTTISASYLLCHDETKSTVCT